MTVNSNTNRENNLLSDGVRNIELTAGHGSGGSGIEELSPTFGNVEVTSPLAYAPTDVYFLKLSR